MDATEVLRVLDALDGAGIEAGVTGGWGIDALLRRETRPTSGSTRATCSRGGHYGA